MLQNENLLANFGFDTAENEPAKNFDILQKILLILLGHHRFMGVLIVVEMVPVEALVPEVVVKPDEVR